MEDVLAFLEQSGTLLQQGWSPQCERVPAGDNEWGVLKTTSVQDGYFLEAENKRLPDSLDAKPNIEIRAGDLLMTCAGPRSRCGVVCLVKKARSKLMFSGKIYRFRPDPRVMDPSFLSYQLRTHALQLQIDAAKTGISESGLNMTRERFFALRLNAPPVAEQRRIAQKLHALLAQVDTLKARIDAIPTLLKRFRRSVLVTAVSGRLTDDWRKKRTLPEFYEVELGHLIKEGPQNGLYKPSNAYGSGVRIIRIDGFYSGEITDWERLRLLDVDPREMEAWGVREGDILINRVNSIEYLGKCALIRSVPEPTVFESNIMRMSMKNEMAHPEYLMRFLSSETGRMKLIANAKHAVNQASINQRDVKSCKVPLPSVEEQTEIVRRVDQLFAFADQLEARLTAAQKHINALTQSLLAKAFRGELVPQDPNDEPASVLLERIRAQRADAPKPRRGRKAVAK